MKELEERLARAMCKSKGYNPDYKFTVLSEDGSPIPLTPAWTLYKNKAKACMNVFADWLENESGEQSNAAIITWAGMKAGQLREQS